LKRWKEEKRAQGPVAKGPLIMGTYRSGVVRIATNDDLPEVYTSRVRVVIVVEQ